MKMSGMNRVLLVGLAGFVAVVTAAQVQPAGTFVRTGDMRWGRHSQTETLLPNGKVLIAGGTGGLSGNPLGGCLYCGYLSGAEVYDPATGVFSPTGDMTKGRMGHTATLLPNGTVLIAGGYPNWSSAEIYDPATGTFAPTGSMVVLRGFNDVYGFSNRGTGRYGHTATLLADGRVLLTGGNGVSVALDAEIYDPSVGTFSPTGATNCILNPGGFSECGMTVRRVSHTATLLDDGTVLILGGSDTTDAELFYPSTGDFVTVAAMSTPRQGNTATRLPNGNVLVAGGSVTVGTGGPFLGTAEIYDWVTRHFSVPVPMQAPRGSHTAAPLSTGRILLVGGYSAAGYLADAEVFDPVASTFASVEAVMELPRLGHTATPLGTGAILLTGGLGGTDPPESLWSAELFQPGPTVNDGTLAAIEDNVAQGTLVATPSGTQLTFAIVSNGSRGTATLTNGSTGAFTYTPFPDANGTDTFTFKATNDAMDSNIATIAVTIQPQNDSPVAIAASVTTDEDVPLSGSLQGSDVDGDVLTWSIVENGALGTATLTNAATGAFTYTPNPNASGTDSFAVSASDGNLTSNVAAITLNVTPVNDAPVATGGTISTPFGAAVNGLLSATDIDGNALAFAIVAGGSQGTAVVTDPATGAYTYTPNASATGVDTFTFKASDGNLDSNTATIAVTILSPPPGELTALVRPPINSDGSSVFRTSRGVIPVKFVLTSDGVPTCVLPAATIALTRTAGGELGSINESLFVMPADSGLNFRIADCQYIYNLGASALGVGMYRVDIVIPGGVVGSASFSMR